MLRTCTIITTNAGADMVDVHDRMPVIIERADFDRWLDPDQHDTEALAKLLLPAPKGTLVRHPVDKAVNSPRNDGPMIIQHRLPGRRHRRRVSRPAHMTTLAQARKIALALPEATEQDHHDMASFRVRGKIFATVPDDTHLRVMVDEMEIRAAVAENPTCLSGVLLGKAPGLCRRGARSRDSRASRGTADRGLDRKAPKKLADGLADG